MPHDQTDRRIAITLFAALWATYALICPGPSAVNANSISRMGFVFAVLDEHRPQIDSFAPFTIDKAEFAGHTYLDKAPGLSFMAIPGVAALRGAADLLGLGHATVAGGALTPFFWLSLFFSTMLTTAVWTAAAAAGLYLFARANGISRGGALFATVGYALCTPAFGWATAFFSHGVTGALLFLGFASVMRASEAGAAPLVAGRFALAGGALLAGAVDVEFTAGIAVAAIVAAGAWRLRRLGAGRAAALLGRASLAGVVTLVPLGLYNAWCFGSPLHLGYSDVVGFDGMQQGMFGITLPKPEVLFGLLFGQHRGLLWIAPLLFAAPVALRASFRRWPGEFGAVLLAVPVLLLLVNAGYAYWDGGASTGPRHLTPAMPFLALAFAPLWDAAGRRQRQALVALAVLSFALSFICAVVTMVSPIYVDHPLPAYLLPRFFGGIVHTVLELIGFEGLGPLLLVALPLWLGVRRIAGLLDPVPAGGAVPGLTAASPG
jgi:hypothetical protein